MINKKIVLVGGGGHCRSCIDVIETTAYEIAGIIDNETKGNKLLDYDIIGNDSDLPALAKKKYLFLVTVGQIKDANLRVRLFEKIKQVNGKLATVVASTAIISKHSLIGEGTIVMHQALINTSAKVGNNCILNTKSLIEHNCTIGNHTHISTAAIINGDCVIGNGVFIGSNSVIAHGVQIADDVVIGSGSVVIKNISEKGIYGGNPAKRIDK
jgi:sugar O-acyltransferase (sialic acid O-acetyltransferase NeuD family)